MKKGILLLSIFIGFLASGQAQSTDRQKRHEAKTAGESVESVLEFMSKQYHKELDRLDVAIGKGEKSEIRAQEVKVIETYREAMAHMSVAEIEKAETFLMGTKGFSFADSDMDVVVSMMKRFREQLPL